MYMRVITLRYQEALGGFPEDALRQATFGRTLLEAREHFFVYGGVPHLSLVLFLSDDQGGAPAKGAFRSRSTGEELVPEASRPLCNALRQWRNERAKNTPFWRAHRRALSFSPSQSLATLTEES